MGLETATYISDLNIANPTSSDPKSQGDDHIRDVLKKSIKNSFPNISGAVTPTHTELNYVDGVTSAIQTQLDSKAPTASPTFTGTVTVPTPTTSTGAVTKQYVDSATFSALSVSPWVTKTTTYTAVAGDRIMADTTSSAWTLTLPASPSVSQFVEIADYAGTFATNNLTVGRNGLKIMGLSEDMTISTNNVSLRLTYIDATRGWRIE